MTNNNNVTGKQVLDDCVTLVKHLGIYVVSVTKRVVCKVKSMLADKEKRQDAKPETDKNTGAKSADVKAAA